MNYEPESKTITIASFMVVFFALGVTLTFATLNRSDIQKKIAQIENTL